MSFISSIRARYLSWSHSTPLSNLVDAQPVFQAWHTFDESAGGWIRLEATHHDRNVTQASPRAPTSPSSSTLTLNLVTWNVDAFGNRPEARMDGILSQLRVLEQVPDIVFFQEVSRQALVFLLNNTWIRDRWISSEANHDNWEGVHFATVTLMSRARFSSLKDHGTYSDPSVFSPGAIWRVRYPSRFKRDALCCDIFHHHTRIRLINVHLDSLSIKPNQRPRQVEMVASLIRHADVGRGIIAGDFNPVCDEDATLVAENGLLDVWETLRSGEDGFTWGINGTGAPFPPGRLDKVAILGLKPAKIDIIHPGTLQQYSTIYEGSTPQGTGQEGKVLAEEPLPWSDHLGLISSFKLVN